jgi:glycerol dehydrogenase-like iron-containing ADH family enzyme
MKLENYEMHLPSYSIGTEVYDHIKTICTPYGKTALIVGGNKARAAAEPAIRQAAQEAGITITGSLLYGQSCTYKTVESLQANPLYQECDMVFAVGGGKAVDTCKCAALSDDKPIFTFPTIASNCASTTSVSIMYNEDGSFLKPHFFTRPANHAFINTRIIAESPERYMWAGIGDTYAKYYEAAVSTRGDDLPHYTAMGLTVSSLCADPVLRFGKEALDLNKAGKTGRALEEVVLAICVTTGLASIFLTRDFTPDYNSGLGHSVFYALTKYPVIEEKHLHGEVVGFGILFLLLVDGQEEEFQKIYAFNKSIGLPVCMDDIDITFDQWDETIDRIPFTKDIQHYPYEVTRPMLEAAYARLESMK